MCMRRPAAWWEWPLTSEMVLHHMAATVQREEGVNWITDTMCVCDAQKTPEGHGNKRWRAIILTLSKKCHMSEKHSHTQCQAIIFCINQAYFRTIKIFFLLHSDIFYDSLTHFIPSHYCKCQIISGTDTDLAYYF